MSSVASRCLVALLAAAAIPLVCAPVSAADGKHPAAPVGVKPAPEPTGSELVGKLLSEQNGPSDPDVPLPQYGLGQNAQPNSTPITGPQIYGRREEGGGVFGLKFPIGVHNGAN